ncbi:WW domain-binding protein 4 [Lingula anatina]|uniref:WW domain-binding protein 4 n=1 Tax=Lingula anatina TaxID=7574 RepID=A0A1S3JS47_LINAN|nr:WW domain-binding protein 4 [Lingula anatina]|eukprot:XP_013413152.1 WW domain-binding protein 4 [Lingula anatina]
MADYWKSNPRKFCEYCKCWIADNKPSIDFHEKGKRHKENVEKKIDELRKKGVADAKKKQFEEDAFKEMELAALEAFKKDLIDNPDLAKQYGVRIPLKTESVATCAPPPNPETSGDAEEDASESTVPEIKEWYEAKSDEGYTYYWNIATGESTWEAPEKYLSLEEQERQQKGDAAPVEDDQSDDTKYENSESKEDPVIDLADIPLDSIPMPSEKIVPKIVEDRNARAAYGSWESAVVEEEQIDLQLPQQPQYEEIPLPDIADDEPKLKFKEKKVTSLKTVRDTGETVAFKKRKISDKKANMRRRGDDDS